MTFKKTTYMQLKSIIAVLLLGTFATNVNAQQIFELSQYTQHNFIVNPAASGANDQSSVGAVYRKMWAGIDGGPQTTILFGDTYFAKKKTGVSLALLNDVTGPTSRTGGQIGLSYSIDMKNGRRLMFGLGGQIMQYKINKAELTNSAYFDPSDPLMSAPGSETKADASAGVYYKTPVYNVGLSVQQIVQSKLDFIKGNTNPQGRLYRQFNLMADYTIHTDDEDVLLPNFLIMYQPNSPIDVQGGIRLEHKKIFWLGASYHYHQSYCLFAGVNIKKCLAIGYAYDQYQTPLNIFENGSSGNEISLRYFF
jgi:type IX secretion system PorP/SprF family membrane protein